MSAIYMLYALISIALLIYISAVDDVGFLSCFEACNVPATNSGAIYMLIRFIIFVLPTELNWYIFYYFPKEFNAKMINSNKDKLNLGVGDLTVLGNDEVAMI